MIADPGRLYTRAQTAAILGLRRANTLTDWIRAGYGPPSVRIGGRRMYRGDDLLIWVSGQTERPRRTDGPGNKSDR